MPALVRLLRLNIIFLSFAVNFIFVVNGQTMCFNSGNSDSLLHPKVQKRFFRVSGELLFAEAVPWLVDDYISHQPWANISFKTMGDNLRPRSWSWDYDEFKQTKSAIPFTAVYFLMPSGQTVIISGNPPRRHLPEAIYGKHLAKPRRLQKMIL
jgi:hypothetical protein